MRERGRKRTMRLVIIVERESREGGREKKRGRILRKSVRKNQRLIWILK